MNKAELVRLARKAARATAASHAANAAWIDAFRAYYGHDDLSDVLVEIIDVIGDDHQITAEFIDEHSRRGES